MSLDRGAIARASLAGAAAFALLGLISIGLLAAVLLPDPDEALSEDALALSFDLTAAIIAASGFLAGIGAGAVAGRVGARAGLRGAALTAAALLPPLIVGALYLTFFGVAGGFFAAGVLGCPAGALIGLAAERRLTGRAEQPARSRGAESGESPGGGKTRLRD